MDIFMNNFLLIPIIIFLHILDDFVIQCNSFLVKGKQKSFWEEQAKGNLKKQEEFMNMYGNDYIVCLLFHAFSWSFVTSLPYLIITYIKQNEYLWFFYFIQLIINTIIHYIVDDLKANKFKINLILDQTIHILQIVFTFIIYINI